MSITDSKNKEIKQQSSTKSVPYKLIRKNSIAFHRSNGSKSRKSSKSVYSDKIISPRKKYLNRKRVQRHIYLKSVCSKSTKDETSVSSKISTNVRFDSTNSINFVTHTNKMNSPTDPFLTNKQLKKNRRLRIRKNYIKAMCKAS